MELYGKRMWAMLLNYVAHLNFFKIELNFCFISGESKHMLVLCIDTNRLSYMLKYPTFS